MTPREKQVLDFVRAELARTGGVAPTVEEICEHLRLSGRGGVHRMLTSLERQGVIVREPIRARGLRLVEPDLVVASDAALLAEVARRGLLRAEAAHA